MKKTLNRKNAPPPLGPYSLAVNYGNLIYTCGQIALDKNGNLIEGGIKEQTRTVLENLKALLEDNGSSLDKTVKATVFLKDINEFAAMNEVYAGYFKKDPPARSTVEVARLPKDARLEIDLIAYI